MSPDYNVMYALHVSLMLTVIKLKKCYIPDLRVTSTQKLSKKNSSALTLILVFLGHKSELTRTLKFVETKMKYKNSFTIENVLLVFQTLKYSSHPFS